MPTILLNNIRPGGKSLTNLRVGSTEVKYVKRGDGKLFYDILSYYSYGTPSVSLSYPSGNTSAAGGTKSPTLSYSQTKTPVGYSGTSYTASSVTSGATVKYEVASGSATVNSTSGVVTWPANLTTSERSATIKVTVTLNGKSNSTTATVKQNGDTVSSYSISLTSDKYTTQGTECAYGGGTCTITAKVTKNWVSGDVTYDKPSLTSSNASFTVGTINSSYQATGTWAASSSTSRRNTTITATYSGATNKTLTLYQAANTSTTTEYEAPVIESVTAKDVPASGGTTSNSYYTVKFYQRQRTKYADGTYSAWSYKYASGTTAAASTITASTTLTGSNLAKTTKSRTKLGSVNITIAYNGKTSSSKSVDVYQQANVKTNTCTSLTIGTFSYATFRGAATETKSPTVSNVTATGTISYTSGDTESYTNSVVTGSISKYYVINSTTYFTIDAYSGAVTTKSVNSGTAERKATVTLSASYGGKTTSKTATVTQGVASTTYNQAWKFSVFNVTNYIYSFGFKFTNSAGNQFTLGGGGGSGGTSNPSREGTSSIRSDISTSVFRPNGFYFTNMSSTYSSANNSSGYYQDGSTGKYYYVRWAYNTAPTTSNYKTHGYKFYSGIVESWTYSASTLYVWVYQS